ncbi:MAG: S41 family peptidase [Wenzhouxiangella sp.]
MKHSTLTILLAAMLLTPALLLADQADLGRNIQRQADVVRAVGLMRYFHPHEATEVVDWNSVLLQGFALADAESSDAEFARALAELLTGLGDGIAHFAPGDEAEEPAALDCGPDDAPVRWVHRGFGGDIAVEPPPFYVSLRSISGRPDLNPRAVSGIVQTLSAERMRQRSVRFSAEVRLINDGEARLWLRVAGPGGETQFLDDMKDRPIGNREWTRHAIDFEVAADAELIILGAEVQDGSQAEFRNIVLEQISPEGEEADFPDLAESAWRLYSPHSNHDLDISADDGGSVIALNPLGDDKAEPAIDRFMPSDAPESLGLALLDGSILHVPMVLCAQQAKMDEAGRQQVASRFMVADVEGLSQTELARLDIAVLWPVMRHFYPYQELVDDWAEMLSVALTEAADVTDRDAHRRVIKRMLVPLQDGHVHVFDADPGAGPVNAWLPISLHTIDGELIVGNSRHVEVRPGDRVTGIDGEPAAAWIETRYAAFSGSSQWRMKRVATRFLEGSRDETRQLVLDRAGESVEVSLVHELDQSLPLHPHEPVMHLPDGVIYVDLTVIDNDKFAEVLPKLVDANAVIVEVRGYPTAAGLPLLSHLLDQVDKKAGWMRILVARGPNGDLIDAERFEWSLPPQSPRIAAPVFFLTDGGAMSYAESILGMVRYNDLGTIVGSNTAGSNGEVIFLELPGQIAVRYTGMRVIGPDGEIIQGVGIEPDVRVYPTIEGLRAGRDEVLERALELIE